MLIYFIRYCLKNRIMYSVLIYCKKYIVIHSIRTVPLKKETFHILVPTKEFDCFNFLIYLFKY